MRDGAETVRIHGEDIPVRASIEEIEYFSVHADRDDVRAWLHSADIAPRRIVLIHGEDDAREDLAGALEQEFDVPVVSPGYDETLSL